MNLKQKLQSIYDIMGCATSALTQDEIAKAALFLGAVSERLRELKDSIDEDKDDQQKEKATQEEYDKFQQEIGRKLIKILEGRYGQKD